jgi:hypothetical protein
MALTPQQRRRRNNLMLMDMMRAYAKGLGGPQSGGGTPAIPPDIDLAMFLGGVFFQLSDGTVAVSANNDPIGYWLDAAGAKTFIQATAGARPLYQSAIPSMLFDGSNDVLTYTGALSDTVGTIIISFITGSTLLVDEGDQVLFSSADTGTANNWFEIGISGDGNIYLSRNVGGTIHRVIGSSVLEESTGYVAMVAFDDTDYYMMVNSTEQNPLIVESVGTPGWFGDVTGADNLCLGGTTTSAGLVRPFNGQIMSIEYYNTDVTQ